MTRIVRHCLLSGLAMLAVVVGSPAANAGAPTAIYTFTGGNDGNAPFGNLVADPAGNLYGVSLAGGPSQHGVVFELSPPVAPSTTWTESVLYSFADGTDGYEPRGGLVRNSAGNLYGTTEFGGGIPNCSGCGTAFELSPPAAGSSTWTFTTIYRFRPVGGAEPQARMTFDTSGNSFGTTTYGGLHPGCCGVVFELSPPASGKGLWTETLLHIFSGGSDGALPEAGLTFDSSGNIYGTTYQGGLRESCCGVAFELTPPAGGVGAWAETVLHTFTGPDGRFLQTDLAFDSSGNLYGAAEGGDGNGAICRGGCGTAFELAPPVGGTGAWTEKTIYRFPGGVSGGNPSTVVYQNGKLYGPAYTGSQGQGALFVLSPGTKKFWSGAADSFTGNAGKNPVSLVTDPAVSGATTFYGVAYAGGSAGHGTIFSWTP